ncbi:MAG: PKD domain-containing protein, partial [Bacteroidota bacterium]
GSVSVIYSSLIFPSDMVTGSDNLLYVVDGISKKVLVMDFAGNMIRTIGSGVLLAPRCIAFDRQNHRIIVTEHGGVGTGTNLHAEIRIFGLTGNLITTFGGYGNAAGKFYRIQGITVGRCGNIYVCDNFQGMISVFNSNGTYITRFGQFGDQLGELNSPLDIDFDSQQKLWVSSMNNGALEVYSITDLLPTATIPSTSQAICPGGFADIPVSFTGTPPFTFTYTVNGLNPVTITNTHNNPYLLSTSVPGTYNVTALSDTISSASCLTGTTDIVLNSAPTATFATTYASICSGTTIDIPVNFTGSKPYSFTYNIDGVNPVNVNNIYSDSYSIHASVAGTYTLTSLSGGGCPGSSITGNTVIAMNPSPTATISNSTTSICSGQSIDIPVLLSGTPPWSFTYSIDGQNPVIVSNILDSNYLLGVAASGNYQLTSISDALCSSGTFAGEVEVNINPEPTAAIVSNNISVCNGESAQIDVNFTGNGPWNFSVSRDGLDTITLTGITTSSFSFPVFQAGSYELISVTASDCHGTVVPGNMIVSVNPKPTAFIPDGNIWICAGESTDIPVSLTGTGPWNLSYTKDGANSITVNNITTSPFMMNVSDSGVYEISSLSDAACSGSTMGGSAVVHIAPLPSAIISSGNVNICSGQSGHVLVDLAGTQPFSLEYTVNGTNPVTVNNINNNTFTIEAIQSGLYEITSVIGHSCASMNFSGTAQVNILPLPIVNLGNDADICEGSSIILDAGGPFVNYNWSNYSTTQTITVTANGTYSVSVTDANGCANYDTLTVTSHPAPYGSFGYSINNFDITFTNTSVNANSWLWNFGDGQTSSLSNPIHSYASSGIYYVSLTVSNPYCGQVTVIDTINLQLTGIADNITASSISIYPNPTNGIAILEISNPGMKYLYMEIFSLTGQLIYSDHFSSAFIKKSINLSGLANGVYTVRLSSQYDVKTEKLILVR